LKCAAENTPPEYNVEALAARSIALACQHNNATSLYCGGIVTLLSKYLENGSRLNLNNLWEEGFGTNLLDRNTLVQLEILEPSSRSYLVYQVQE
jgi:hypothetical protein